MNAMLDTHAFLWFVLNDSQLQARFTPFPACDMPWPLASVQGLQVLLCGGNWL
jgi:hypothetical protein